MSKADIVVAGGGVSGLLIAGALAQKCAVTLIEQSDSLPKNKYWLSDERAASENPHLAHCVDRRYEFLDFIAYDGLTARICGHYCLWDTEKLVQHLTHVLSAHGVRILTGHKLYSIAYNATGIVIRANSETFYARLLIDCMGFGSPLVGAKNTATIAGYYIMHGCEVAIRSEVAPIALDNVVIDRQPAFFELFPTSKHTAHAGIILPARQYKPSRSLKGELHFILSKSHYSQHIVWNPTGIQKSYFGIIPVGRLRKPALDRIVFFGEAGQANPAASATGLSRMLRTYRELATSLITCLERDELGDKQLQRAIPRYMTTMNRVFQETLFESLLSFDSDDFRRLVRDLQEYPDEVINDLVFADFEFGSRRTLRLALDAIARRDGVLGAHVVKSALRFLSRRSSV
ncbi:MAG: lycopene cyclase family protein [Candidatus Sulfotelmatobacter sp.]